MSKRKTFFRYLFLGSIFLCGCSTSREDIKNMHPNGIIFLATPSKSNEYYNPFWADLLYFHEAFGQEKIAGDTVLSLPYKKTAYDDIWIRDVAPVVTSKLVKFIYAPSYLPPDLSAPLHNNFKDWLLTDKFEVTFSTLILDGGNVIWNQKDTVILTTQILVDNPTYSKEEIVAQLKKDLSVYRVILIPPETGDLLAHADGMVKFLDETTLFISDFSGDEKFQKEVEKIILKEMPDATFITIPSAYTDEDQYDEEIASAKGLYINMLETDNAVYMPQFNLPEDAEMKILIQKHTSKPVVSLDLEHLSTMGGAINCLTWYCPSKFLPLGFY